MEPFSFYEQSRLTLFFQHEIIEVDYREQLGKRHLTSFRLAYFITACLILLKIALILYLQTPTSNANRNYYYSAAAAHYPYYDWGVNPRQYDVLVTIAAGPICLAIALLFSGKKPQLFFQFYSHINFFLFVFVGLTSAVLPNAISSTISARTFQVVAELYLLFFPFAFALRINFPANVVGGWALLLSFFAIRCFVLHDLPETRSIPLNNEHSNTTTTTENLQTVHQNNTNNENAAEKANFDQLGPFELTTVTIYLLVGLMTSNLLAYYLDKLERIHFFKVMKNSSQKQPV